MVLLLRRDCYYLLDSYRSPAPARYAQTDLRRCRLGVVSWKLALLL